MASVYCFGRFQLWPSERRLAVEGRSARISARTVSLLIALVEHRCDVVDKEKLLDLVWPDTAVEENNLAVHVSALRKLLGRGAVITVPGRGYRFAPAVEVRTEVPAHRSPPAARSDTQAAAAWPVPDATLPPPARLLGRTQDLADLAELVAGNRVVTLAGPAGVGKTSLALGAAHALRSEGADVAWVDMSAVGLPFQAPHLIAQALGLAGDQRHDIFEALPALLGGRQMVLIIDNAEHVRQAVGQLVSALAARAPELRVLATSQAPLRIHGERVFRLAPLSVPGPHATPEEALVHGAVALFVDQARAVDRRFALTPANTARVVDLCRRLDGLPLSIKLAAARVHLFGVEGLDARLSDRFRLLRATRHDAPGRHQSLSTALEWSYGLLSRQEQSVFRRLGVFVGGFTLELAAATAQDDVLDHWAVEDALQGLVDHSLVAVEHAEPPRYRLLESAREYALIKLALAAEEQATRHRHALALHAQFAALDESEQVMVYAPEVGNLCGALDWCLAHDQSLGANILSVVDGFFGWLGLPHEARERRVQFASLAGRSKRAGASA